MKTHRLDLTERIGRYVDACPPALSGQRGHDTTFKVAIALVRGFNLSPARALAFMHRFNQRCEPAWTERELRHKLDSADTLQAKIGKPIKPRGYLL